MPAGDKPTSPSARALAFALLAFAALGWAGNYVLGRAIAGEVPPAALAVARWLLALLVLLPFSLDHLRRDAPMLIARWRIMLLLGLTGAAVFGTLSYWGLQFTTATNAGLLGATSPVMIALAGSLLFGDRLALRQGLGLALSLGGALTIVARGDVANLTGLMFNAGDLMILATLVAWSIYCTSLRLKPLVHWTSFSIAMFAVGSAANVPFAIAESLAGNPLRATLVTAGTIAYTGLVASLAAYVAWNRGVELVGAQRAGPFLNLVPVFSLLLANLLLGERLERFHAIASVLIFAGIALATMRVGAAAAARARPAEER